MAPLALPGVDLSPAAHGHLTTRFDLEAHASPFDGGMALRFVYRLDLFDASTVRRMLGHFEQLLRAAVAAPRRRLHELPMVAPGEWQSYDIIFRAARFDDDGDKTDDATITVLHNGVLIQDHADVPKRTTASPFDEGQGDGPLFLQDHGNPVRYRNIWYRPL